WVPEPGRGRPASRVLSAGRPLPERGVTRPGRPVQHGPRRREPEPAAPGPAGRYPAQQLAPAPDHRLRRPTRRWWLRLRPGRFRGVRRLRLRRSRDYQRAGALGLSGPDQNSEGPARSRPRRALRVLVGALPAVTSSLRGLGRLRGLVLRRFGILA